MQEREGAAEAAMWRDIDKARSEYHVLMVPKNTVPPDARLAECYETSREWVVVGEPWRGEDESDPRYHNCDTMGCGTLFHVVARIQKPKGHTESKPSIAEQKTCPSCKHRFIPSFNARCPKCGHNLTPRTTCAAEYGSLSSPAMSTRLLAALQAAYDKVEPVESYQHWGIAGRPAYRDGYRDGERSGLYGAIQILKASSAAIDRTHMTLPILDNRPAGDVIACRYCKLRMTLAEVKTWVGCDACNDGEDWLKAAIQNASSPPTKRSDGSANNQ